MNSWSTSRHTLAGLVLLASSFSALAQAGAPATPRVDARQAHQAARIQHGQATGALTARESQRLQRQQVGIARAEAHAKADGRVTPRERQHLQRLQDAASRNIARQAHDAQTTRGR